MQKWPQQAKLFEIHAGFWLEQLSRKYDVPMTLAQVPASEWDAIAEWGFDAVWLMGIWERSPAGIAVSNTNEGLLKDFRRTLPDFLPEDNVGSPYCVRRYVADQRFGGAAGLKAAREELARRGLRLVLDFVPNHIAPDHPWTTEHPEYFIHGNTDDLERDPASFLKVSEIVFACGRDPYFPAWPDVLQLNAFHPGLRTAATDTVLDIASQCDAVRCDMAMLMLNSVVERTWGDRAGSPPPEDYWSSVIPTVKSAHPDFLFIAEAYWDLEWELQQQGFDYCYDKTLYHRLESGNAESVRLHLCADRCYQNRLLRFIENHDEPRAASAFSDERHRPAAIVAATIPGAALFHDGQFEGRRARHPIFLDRRREEAADEELRGFYRKLLGVLRDPAFREGEWRLCETVGWPDNTTFRDILSWTWISPGSRYVVAIDYSANAAQARIPLAWAADCPRWRLTDAFTGESFDRDGAEMAGEGLFVGLEPWAYHVLRCESV